MGISEQPQPQENFATNPYKQREQLGQLPPQKNFEANIYKQREQAETTKKPNEDRIVLLTDGIFAIALTLLVLGIQVPNTNSLEVFNKALNGDFLSNTMYYVLTFAVLISYWRSHRTLMNTIERIDNTFIEINVIFLVFVAFFPVTNSLLNDSQFPEAVIIYTIVLAGCGYSSTLLWLYALGKRRLLAPETDVEKHKYRILIRAFYPTFFLLSLFILLIPHFAPNHIFYTWPILPAIYIFYSNIFKPIARSRRKNSMDE